MTRWSKPDQDGLRHKESELATDPSRGVLNERGTTHGDFVENGEIMQALKELMRAHRKWLSLYPYQQEALEMIQHKIGRILCGDPNYYDHWRDIAGYAKLVEERCPQPGAAWPMSEAEIASLNK